LDTDPTVEFGGTDKQRLSSPKQATLLRSLRPPWGILNPATSIYATRCYARSTTSHFRSMC